MKNVWPYKESGKCWEILQCMENVQRGMCVCCHYVHIYIRKSLHSAKILKRICLNCLTNAQYIVCAVVFMHLVNKHLVL